MNYRLELHPSNEHTYTLKAELVGTRQRGFDCLLLGFDPGRADKGPHTVERVPPLGL